MPCRPELFDVKYRASASGTTYVDGFCVAVLQYAPRPAVRYVYGSQACGGKAKAARLAMPAASPWAFLQPSMSLRSSSALAEVPIIAKSFAQALMTQLAVALGSSLESQKSTTTLRPASPPLALTSLAHSLTAFTDFWNSPGTSALLTSAIMATWMVLAVSPTSLPEAADPAGEAACVGDADPDAVAAADELLLLLEEELHPAASRTAATIAAITPKKRARLCICHPAPLRPGLSLLGLTSVPSTTSLPVRIDPAAPAF